MLRRTEENFLRVGVNMSMSLEEEEEEEKEEEEEVSEHTDEHTNCAHLSGVRMKRQLNRN